MRRRASAPFIVSVVSVVGLCVASCNGTPPLAPLEVPEGCNPLLAGVDCFLPYPSDVFLVDDEASPSGHRVVTTGAAKRTTARGLSADVGDLTPADGFSRTPTIAAILGQAIADVGLVHIRDNPQASTEPASRTLILDATTGAAVPHWVDLDGRADDPLRKALLLRPSVMLAEEHRYVVVLQGLTDPSGAVVPAPEGYRRLRDDVAGDDPALAPLARRYASDVFPVLATAGVDRAKTQLVWDFTTGADIAAMQDMLQMRALVLEELAVTPPTVTIDLVREDAGPGQWLQVLGTVTGPSVMEGDAGAGTRLARDANGQVRLNGTVSFPFRAVVTPSVRDSVEGGHAILYGHGFFGGAGELTNGTTPRVIDVAHGVAFAIDWWGMSSQDVGVVVSGVGERVSESLLFGERVPQAMANWLSLTAAIRGPLKDATDPVGRIAFRRSTDPAAVDVQVDGDGNSNAGAVFYDDTEGVDWFGISQGHILGGTHAALNPDLHRIVLQVGGCAFTHMMARAAPFKQYLALLDISLDDKLMNQQVIATYQRGFDRFDPSQYARYVLAEDLPFGPPSGRERKEVLLQIGTGDHQVPNVASWLHARILGVPLVTPSARDVPLLATTAAPATGSGMFVFDVGDDESFYDDPQPAQVDTEAHERLRRTDEVREQIRAFLDDGVIVNPCDGACINVPELDE
jgi:hypothetical protein